MAHILSEALPYMQRYDDKTVVIKYGGHAMGDARLAKQFAHDVVLLKQSGMNPIVVHGGGPQIAEKLEKLRIKSEFKGGLRVTTDETIEIVEVIEIGDPTYEPFPNGYGYMENTDSLEKAVVDKNMAYIREHSWSLWAGIMQPADSINWPIWYAWKYKVSICICANSKIK